MTRSFAALITIAVSLLSVTGRAAESADACRANILKITCSTSREFKYDERLSMLENLRREQDPSACHPVKSAKYAQMIFDLYPSLPTHSQAAFCFIKRIVIEPNPWYGGMAQTYYDIENAVEAPMDQCPSTGHRRCVGVKPSGYVIRLSEKWRLLRNETISEMRTRRFQKMFGINTDVTGLHPALPRIQYINDSPRTVLYSTLVHEIGHLFFESLNSLEHERMKAGEISDRTYFSNFSWSSDAYPLIPKDPTTAWFRDIGDGRLVASIDQQDELIRKFNESPFSTFYAYANDEEDFAEHYTTLMMKGDLIIVKNGQVLSSPEDKNKLEIYRQKSQFIRDRLSYGFDGFSRVTDHTYVTAD